MYYVLLCGGQGKRFSQSVPQCKPYPMIGGLPMYKFVIDSLNLPEGSKIVVVVNDDTQYVTYDFARDYPRYRWIHSHLPYVTRGPCESVSLGLRNITDLNPDEPFWVLDNDVIYDANTDWGALEKNGDALYILGQNEPTDEENSPYCHIETDGDVVVNLHEKKNISEWVAMGGYGFPSFETFESLYGNLLSEAKPDEYFLSRLFQKALQKMFPCKVQRVEDSFTVGVPGQVYDAIYTGKIKMKPLRWVFDLDGTLVSAPTTHRDYSTCVPIEKTCNFVRYLYRNDHHIIIHTARHMRTCGGDVGEVVRRIGEITERYLREHDIPYHEIIYGKPYADIYVDDRAMNPCYWDRGNGWTTSSLGFGLDLSFRASSNSKIFKIDDHVCVKREDPSTLCGYVHHLKNVPAGLRDNVPRLLKFDHGSLVMQWIEGIPLGKMFCSGSLDLHVFDQVLELLSVIHDQKTDECREVRADVMRNYVPKLSERRAKYRELYELSSLDHEEVMEKLKSFFGNYRPVVKDCIHGDFWFGNLLWSHAEQKIYMIDMRGKVGDVVHLGGDMYYDYGKLYQSLSGFDWLINKGRLPDETYRDLFLRRFGEHVEKNDLDLNVIKTIAFGHMYGSLPFHKEIRENIRVYDELMTTLFLQI